MVGGFLTRHRWLERVRSAGPLLMASYGRRGRILRVPILKIKRKLGDKKQLWPGGGGYYVRIGSALFDSAQFLQNVGWSTRLL